MIRVTRTSFGSPGVISYVTRARCRVAAARHDEEGGVNDARSSASCAEVVAPTPSYDRKDDASCAEDD